ncbi:hypothetical protein ACN27E_13575 [Mycobacterium sp. WMMD1722]|uniref:hypothetical protein n=1 Tax=Mycobacterium sp. WMMD1722 TaxID=3404117 RepID=UPI003BF58BCA
MRAQLAAAMAALATVARGTGSRRLGVRRGAERRRHRETFDDLERDSRLEHQNRTDGGTR